MQALTVSELAIYPVKSLGGIALQQMQFDRFGPVCDRRYIVVDNDARFVTQREYAQMSLVRLTLNGYLIEFSAPSMSIFTLDTQRAVTDARKTVTVWRDRVTACDMGEEIAAWLSSYLGIAVRLFYMPDDSVRHVDPTYGNSGDRVSFADGFPVLLIGAASLREFNCTLPEPIGSERFRPNIVVAGAEPYAEDQWRRIRIGTLEFDVVKPCSRCVIPSIDPLTGKKQPIVAQTLARLRRRGDAVYFGQNLVHRGIGTIAIGAPVTVLE
ncbi:MAG TPA: MOSC N-terminal beta barrel domain-containing protein [Spongiibacteraceae bacterium]